MSSLYGAVLPIMHGGPPAPAVGDTYGEDAEEEEEAGHAEAHLVDCGVAHQSLAALPCAHLVVEGDLWVIETPRRTRPSSTHARLREKRRSCLFRAAERRLAFLDVTPLKEQKERTGGNNGPSFSA